MESGCEVYGEGGVEYSGEEGEEFVEGDCGEDLERGRRRD